MDRSPHLFATDRYEDITEQLLNAAKSMEQGSVALAPGMTLHDALPAFQIGSEKVDTGSPDQFRLLGTEIETARAVWPIDASEQNCCTFLDAVAGVEMAWHAGFSPVQTVISCLLLEQELNELTKNPRSLVDSLADTPEIDLQMVTRAYILSVILSVGISVDLANACEALYPEEDLHITRPWMHLIERVGGLPFVVERLERCYKQASAAQMPKLATRLSMRLSWITVLRQRIPKKTVHLETMTKYINEVFPASSEDSAAAEGDEKVRLWFSNGCQVRLEMECLRLETEMYTRQQTRDQWLQIITAISKCVPVYSVQRSVDLLGFFLQFSIRQEPAIVRAMLKSLVVSGQVMGQSTKQWVIKDICETAPPINTTKLKNKSVDRFLGQAVLCYTDLLSIFCQNRCRLREGLSALIIAFDSLQVAASHVDDHVVGTLLSSWVFFRKLQVMLWVVLLAFETDVVSYREAACTNWFAFRLAQHLLSHLGRMRQSFELHGRQAREAPGYGFLVALELESQVLSQLLTAEYMLFMALHKANPPKPIAELGPSEEMLFGLRFQMFQSVGVPSVPTLAQYKEEFEAIDTETALRGSANASQSVRGLLNSLGPLAAENPEIPKLKRSAIGLSVAVSAVIRGHKYAGMDTNGYHAYFPVPKLLQQ